MAFETFGSSKDLKQKGGVCVLQKSKLHCMFARGLCFQKKLEYESYSLETIKRTFFVLHVSKAMQNVHGTEPIS